jgi:hypothetical protein
VPDENSVVATFDHHGKAEAAVRELLRAGFQAESVSIAGKGDHTGDKAVGHYTAADRIMNWGRDAAFWGGMWGLLFGSGFFLVPGVGPLLVAGPLVAWIVVALEREVAAGGASALGTALSGVGVPEQNVLQYESAVRAGKFLLVAHGTADEVTRARVVLSDAGVPEAEVYLAVETSV